MHIFAGRAGAEAAGSYGGRVGFEILGSVSQVPQQTEGRMNWLRQMEIWLREN